MRKLTSFPIRTDLTDRECSTFLNGVVAGLCALAPAESVRNAFRYWAGKESDAEWDAIRNLFLKPPASDGKKSRDSEPVRRDSRGFRISPNRKPRRGRPARR